MKSSLNHRLIYLGVLLVLLDQLLGWAFGWYNQPLFPWASSWLSEAVAVFLLLVWLALFQPRVLWPLVFLLAGIVSNIITYAHLGHFLDYLPLGFSATNLADLNILIGCLGLICFTRVTKPHSSRFLSRWR